MKTIKKKIKITLVVVAVAIAALCVALSATNPAPSDHLKVVSEYLSNYDWSQVELTEEQQAQYTAYMSSGLNANIMDKVVKPRFHVQDYGLWSVGRINGQEVTFGIFNKVILTDTETGPEVLLDVKNQEY